MPIPVCSSPLAGDRTYRYMADVYRECGYETIELPKLTPAGRARFLLDQLRLGDPCKAAAAGRQDCGSYRTLRVEKSPKAMRAPEPGGTAV